MNAHTQSKVARHSKRWDPSVPRRLTAALQEFSFGGSSAQVAIEAISPDFELDGISLDPDSTIIEGDEWIAPGTIFVKINYQEDDGPPETFNESFPILVKFVVSDEGIMVKDIEADVSSFDQ